MVILTLLGIYVLGCLCTIYQIRAPLKIVTWRFWLNCLIFQWFFVRLSKTNVEYIDPKANYQINIWYHNFLYWIVPLTGWSRGYITLPRLNHYKLWPKLEVGWQEVLTSHIEPNDHD